MPRKLFLPEWVWFVGFLLTVVVAALTRNEWYLLAYFVLLISQGIYACILVRCPTCHGRLKFHKGYFPGSMAFRIQLDCAHCLVRWDTGKQGSDDTH